MGTMPAARSADFVILLSAACVIFAGEPAQAQRCVPISVDAIDSLRSLSVSAVRIVTASPERMPGPAAALENIHVRTSEETIRRQLSVRAGDSFDPVTVRESIHRLRRQPYLAAARLEVRECRDSVANFRTVELRVMTKDSWSTRPTIKIRSSASAILGLEERNLLGTGRAAKVYLRSDAGRLGVGVAYSDPWLGNSPFSATLSRNVFRDGSDWRATLSKRQQSAFDRWNAALSAGRSAQIGVAVPDSFRKSAASLTVTRLLQASSSGAISLIGGMEMERARLSVISGAQITGPRTVNRNFAGVDIGLSRRSVRYGLVDWYLPGGSSMDLPLGFEGEGIFGVGRDFTSGSPAARVNLWGGRIWMPRPDLFASTDAWITGYVNRGAWSAGTRRAAVSVFKQAWHGVWLARAAGEQLVDPDPDVRALFTLDPAIPALPKESRLAESAVSLSLERAVHLFGLTRGYMIDGAMFGALSSRWDPAGSAPGPLSLGVLGAGLRLVPTHLGRASLRLDVGYPVAAGAGVRRRLFFGVSLVPWIEAGRSRQLTY